MSTHTKPEAGATGRTYGPLTVESDGYVMLWGTWEVPPLGSMQIFPELICNCDSYKIQHVAAHAKTPHVFCQHMAEVVRKEWDRGFLELALQVPTHFTVDSYERSEQTGIKVYWTHPKRPRALWAAVWVALTRWQDGLWAVVLDPSDADAQPLGFVRPMTACRREIAQIVAPELILIGMATECEGCHNCLANTFSDHGSRFNLEDEEHRALALQRGAVVLTKQHDGEPWLCADCDQSDLIPDV